MASTQTPKPQSASGPRALPSSLWCYSLLESIRFPCKISKANTTGYISTGGTWAPEWTHCSRFNEILTYSMKNHCEGTVHHLCGIAEEYKNISRKESCKKQYREKERLNAFSCQCTLNQSLETRSCLCTPIPWGLPKIPLEKKKH